MALGDSEASLGYVMGHVDMTARRTTGLEAVDEIFETTDDRAPGCHRCQVDVRPEASALTIGESSQRSAVAVVE